MLLDLFKTFFKIGAFTFGGGFAMIPIIKQEIVDDKGWIEEEDFLDIISVAQSSPGPIAVNSSIFVGYKIKGFPGALICTIGTVLPSFITILIVATFFYGINDNPIMEKIFSGIRPAVVALIFSTVYKLIKGSSFSHLALFVASITAIIIVLTGVNPIIMIILGVIGSIIFNKYIKVRIDNFHR